MIAYNAAFRAKLLHFGEDDDASAWIIEGAIAVALASEESATVVRLGMVAIVDLMDGTCLGFPAEIVRLIVSGNP